MYKALYLKWRPAAFEDVISQEHITTTLKNQVSSGKTAHAYIFTGSRGTGKTTCARILAKAVNCESPIEGTPCCVCDICRDADSFALSDIVEIDAASNNGVDDIRDLRENAVFTPERCKYRIYIIDEVHMLSINAFNALLKLLEEPPKHVKFILATTEIHKVPATILSRCQRFDFRRIRTLDIAQRLLYISEVENLNLSADASQLIARIADGGMRDALSLLDQCAAFSDEISADTVATAAGLAGREYLKSIVADIFSGNSAGVIEAVSGLYSQSKDMQRLCDEIIVQLRNIMLIKISPNDKDILDCLPGEEDELMQIASQTSIMDVLEKMRIMQSCAESLPRALNKRVTLEMSLIRICSPVNENSQSSNNPQIGALMEKIESLESQLSGRRVDRKKTLPEEVPPEQQVDFTKLRPQDFTKVNEWNDVLEEFFKVCPSVSGTLAGSAAFVNGSVMLIVAQNPFFLSLFKDKENAIKLGETVKKVLGKSYVIRAKSKNPEREAENNALKIIEKASQSGIEVKESNE